jgi:hypothetical protein
MDLRAASLIAERLRETPGVQTAIACNGEKHRVVVHVTHTKALPGGSLPSAYTVS